jgi:hypothetical protein
MIKCLKAILPPKPPPPPRLQSSSWDHSASYTIGTEGSFTEGKAAIHRYLCADVTNAWIFTSIPYVLVAWRLSTQRQGPMNLMVRKDLLRKNYNKCWRVKYERNSCMSVYKILI